MDLNEETIEDTFNINKVLETLFSSVKSIATEKRIELLYEMDSTIPRKLRGDSDALLLVLNKILTFVFQNSDKKEIVLSLSSVEDFLYEEFISFRIQETHIEKEKLQAFLKIHLNKEIEMLGGNIVYDNENMSDIHISIPFKNFELGFRRHYRLPHKNAVGKKILVICSNDKTAQSLKKMFQYFHYDVHTGMDELKKHGNDLSIYDILIISEKMITEKTKETIAKVQERAPLKYVLLRDPYDLEDDIKTDAEHFIKPITQEKVFDLIVSLYEEKPRTEKSDTTLIEKA
ncbi:hypothetical protein MN086_01590 [Sulfurovum sp. XGS-02]|uniref:hypothetical protein n=1 Tax=Sulfurovum sp. XGS-02 TaxID=2925411 RepID=UPI0020565695|nr:hypothetical protein [Sulfurovum sp. XGS-02]UPT77852.1 hypothetical protein MN086_01590 [Sulfurovum sp. XGS-02]